MRKEREAEIQMRQYRGIPIGGKDFVYGWYFERGSGSYIIPITGNYHTPASFVLTFVPVIPESICQFTGLEDKNGTEGHRDDIISFGSTRPLYLIKWSICNAGFYLESLDGRKGELGIVNFTVGKIIGNKWEHPKLMEQENG